jgi:F0F1-type ATP synthase membrane subunit b/b'
MKNLLFLGKHKKQWMTISLSTILLVFGCDFTKKLSVQIDNAEKIISDALTDLNDNSRQWQTVLRETESKLTEDAQSTIKNEVSNTLNRAIATAGTEFRCNADFVRDRVKAELQRILDNIRNKTSKTPIPIFCQVIPNSINMNEDETRRNKLDISGYNFDKLSQLSVKVLDQNGAILLDNGSQHLNRVTHYNMVLNLSSNGLRLTNQAKSIVISFDNVEISRISVEQPPLPCTTFREQDLNPVTESFLIEPPFVTNDDREFTCGRFRLDLCKVRLSLANAGQEVAATFEIQGEECCHDTGLFDPCKCGGFSNSNCYTRIGTTQTRTIFRAPAGFKINSILSSTVSNSPQTNIRGANNLDAIAFDGNFLRRITVQSVNTNVKTVFTFNPIRVQLCNK